MIEDLVTGEYRRRMVAALAKRPYGLTTRELFDAVYFDDPDGGPNSLKIFSVMKRHINKQLRRHGYVIEAEMADGARFKIMSLLDGRRWRKARSMRALRHRRKLDADRRRVA
jgi:hypothetical protein